MKIAIASGKGGTGKTTLALAIAIALSSKKSVTLLDCDVEEPNCKLFLKMDFQKIENVEVNIPYINEPKCIACGTCAQFCRFNAIASLGSKILIFEELCHSCGGCARVCPTQAISEKKKKIGTVSSGSQGNLNFAMGAIDIGYPIASSVIQATLECQFGAEYVIIDSPPGASCPMVSAVKDADFVMLVTEPTAFGLHDLKIAVDVVTKLNIPFGVILNKSDSGDDRVNHFCSLKSIPILLEIKEERRIAELYSNGLTLIDALPEYKQKLIDLIEKLQI